MIFSALMIYMAIGAIALHVGGRWPAVRDARNRRDRFDALIHWNQNPTQKAIYRFFVAILQPVRLLIWPNELWAMRQLVHAERQITEEKIRYRFTSRENK